jgi:hypothetical protein
MSGILSIGFVMTVSALIFDDGSSALIAAAVGVLFLGLYVVLNRVMDWWDARREPPKV